MTDSYGIQDPATKQWVKGNPNASTLKFGDSNSATEFDSKRDAQIALERRDVHPSIVSRWVRPR